MNNVVNAARRYLGCPYHHQGRSEHGIDCAGLLVAAYQDCGIELIDLPAYGREPWRDGLRQAVEQNFAKVDRDPQPGDVLLLRWRYEPQHLAIVTDKGIIHAYASAGKVVETTYGPAWRNRTLGVYAR